MFSANLTKQYPSVTKFLTASITQNKLANSYIFIGNDTGEITQLVINLAKILNCEKNKYSNPCNICTTCKWIEKNEHPHALTIITHDEKSKKEQIKIEIIRELLEKLNITSDFFRVIFFQKSNLNYLSAECCNLLLKTVEEASEKTIFIFANNTKNDILPTIQSRSQILYFSKKNNFLHGEVTTAEYFSNNIQSAIEKAKKAYEQLEESEVSLKEYLGQEAYKCYEKYKDLNPKQFCKIYKSLNSAYLKYNSFMQPKIIIEDLFLGLTK